MKINRTKIDRQTRSIVVELIEYADKNIFVLCTKLLDNNTFVSTLYYCAYADAFEFKYNTEGTDILTEEVKRSISKQHLKAKDKLFFAFDKDSNRYTRILNALKD